MGENHNVEAVLFDFLGTLVCFERLTAEESIASVLESLRKDGCALDYEIFHPVYKESTERHWSSRRGYEETYNKYWITDALKALGIQADPEQAMITRAVEAYFEPFHQVMKPMPGALETLEALKGRYRLGLISNFTYSPTVVRALDELNMSQYLETVVVSADVGIRKPSPVIFQKAMTNLRLSEPGEVIFVGDDVDADIMGALRFGMIPILISYTLKDDYRARLAGALNAMEDGMARDVREIRLPPELLELPDIKGDGG
jgi:putative hydrolase of the HAD superfamily